MWACDLGATRRLRGRRDTAQSPINSGHTHMLGQLAAGTARARGARVAAVKIRRWRGFQHVRGTPREGFSLVLRTRVFPVPGKACIIHAVLYPGRCPRSTLRHGGGCRPLESTGDLRATHGRLGQNRVRLGGEKICGITSSHLSGCGKR